MFSNYFYQQFVELCDLGIICSSIGTELCDAVEGNETGEHMGSQGRTVQQLTEELQSIMETVNARVAGQNVPVSDDFVGLEEAIQATLQVTQV